MIREKAYSSICLRRFYTNKKEQLKVDKMPKWNPVGRNGIKMEVNLVNLYLWKRKYYVGKMNVDKKIEEKIIIDRVRRRMERKMSQKNHRNRDWK